MRGTRWLVSSRASKATPGADTGQQGVERCRVVRFSWSGPERAPSSSTATRRVGAGRSAGRSARADVDPARGPARPPGQAGLAAGQRRLHLPHDRPGSSRPGAPVGRYQRRRGLRDARRRGDPEHPQPGVRAVLVGRHRVHALRDSAPPGRSGQLTDLGAAGPARCPGARVPGTRKPHAGPVDVARFPHRTAPAVPQRRGARPG